MITIPTKISAPPASLIKIRATVGTEWTQLNEMIKSGLSRDDRHPMISEIVDHMTKNSGKRLRPLLGMLIAKTFANNEPINELSIQLACIIELIHTATLLHDDVIDNSLLRRSQSSANAIWGNHAPILVGDYIYSIAVELLLKTDNKEIMLLIAPAITRLVEGEIMQMSNTKKYNKKQYFETIYRKTAILFEIMSQCTAISNHGSLEQTEASKSFGCNLGLAFQVVDDILDYTACSDTLGKNIGDDLKQGKITLPLIHALDRISTREKTAILKKIESDSINLEEIQELINRTDAAQQSYQHAEHYHQIALEQLVHLPQNKYTDQLRNLIEFNRHRVK